MSGAEAADLRADADIWKAQLSQDQSFASDMADLAKALGDMGQQFARTEYETGSSLAGAFKA